MDLYGINLLHQIHSAYFSAIPAGPGARLPAGGNRFFWLYEELHYRLQVLRRSDPVPQCIAILPPDT